MPVDGSRLELVGLNPAFFNPCKGYQKGKKSRSGRNMKNFIKKNNNFILARFIGVTNFSDKVTDASMRQKYAYLEAWISIFGKTFYWLVSRCSLGQC